MLKPEEITVGDVPRLLAELVNGQKRIETDVAALKTDVAAIRKHLNIDEEIHNLETVEG